MLGGKKRKVFSLSLLSVLCGLGGIRSSAAGPLCDVAVPRAAVRKSNPTIYSDRTKWALPSVGVDSVLIDSGAGTGTLAHGDVGEDGTADGSKVVGKYFVYNHFHSERDGVVEDYSLSLDRPGLAADALVSNHQYLFIGAKTVDSTHVFQKAATSGTELFGIVGTANWVTATYQGFSGFVLPASMINQLQYASFDCGSFAISSAYSMAVYGYDAPNNMVNGSSRTVTLSVDAKVTQAALVAGVSAQDFFGVPCTVVVKSSDYVIGKVGVFHIVLTATDTYGNTATGTLIVNVVDRTAPVVSKKSDILVRYGTSLTADEALSHYTITDNVDSTFTTAWTLPANFVFGSAISYGKYNLILSVKDLAGNETKVNVSVTAYDDVPPVISRKDGGADSVLIYGYSSVHLVTENALLALYAASDVVSGACAVYLKSGSVDTTIGDHSIVIAAHDAVGNEAVKTVNYHIQVDVPPVFILSDSLIQVMASIPLSIDDLTKAIAAIPTDSGVTDARVGGRELSARRLFAASARTNIVVNSDDFAAYLAGSDVVGAKYSIRYSYVDGTTGKVGESIVYLLVSADPDAVAKKSWWDNFVDFVSHFWERLLNWLAFRGWKTNAELTSSVVPSSSAADSSAVPSSKDGSSSVIDDSSSTSAGSGN